MSGARARPMGVPEDDAKPRMSPPDEPPAGLEAARVRRSAREEDGEADDADASGGARAGTRRPR